MRSFRSWPTWLLRLVLRLPSWRGSWSDAWIEIYQREVIDPAIAATDNDSGPWLVAPPPGMH